MDVKKILGYVLSAVGLLGVAASSSDVIKGFLFGFLGEEVSGMIGTSLLVGSLVVLGAGVVLLFVASRGNKGGGGEEVPIYEGKRIVGYRRR